MSGVAEIMMVVSSRLLGEVQRGSWCRRVNTVVIWVRRQRGGWSGGSIVVVTGCTEAVVICELFGRVATVGGRSRVWSSEPICEMIVGPVVVCVVAFRHF